MHRLITANKHQTLRTAKAGVNWFCRYLIEQLWLCLNKRPGIAIKKHSEVHECVRQNLKNQKCQPHFCAGGKSKKRNHEESLPGHLDQINSMNRRIEYVTALTSWWCYRKIQGIPRRNFNLSSGHLEYPDIFMNVAF